VAVAAEIAAILFIPKDHLSFAGFVLLPVNGTLGEVQYIPSGVARRREQLPPGRCSRK